MEKVLIKLLSKMLMLLVNTLNGSFNSLNKSKRGIVIKKNSQIIDLIKNTLNNNDYLMIKG